MLVKSNKELAYNIYELQLYANSSPAEDVSGKFLHIKIPQGELLLRRPFSIASFEPNESVYTVIYKVVGAGTQSLTEVKPGVDLDVLGPLGNGYDLTKLTPNMQVVLIGGGVGVPPLYQLAKTLHQLGVETIHVLGFRSQNEIFYLDKFKELGETHVTTDDGSFGIQGTVLDALIYVPETPNAVFSCGPKPLLKAVGDKFSTCSNVQLSLEERMACGIGACYGCICKAKDGKHNFKVCKDGPVFQLEDIVL